MRFLFVLFLLSAAGSVSADFLPLSQCNCAQDAYCTGVGGDQVVPVDFFDLQPAAVATAANILARSDETYDYELLGIDYCVNDTQTIFSYLVRYNRILASNGDVFGRFGASASVNAGNQCAQLEGHEFTNVITVKKWESVDWPDVICDVGCLADIQPFYPG